MYYVSRLVTFDLRPKSRIADRLLVPVCLLPAGTSHSNCIDISLLAIIQSNHTEWGSPFPMQVIMHGL
jgi:hypothetical protein